MFKRLQQQHQYYNVEYVIFNIKIIYLTILKYVIFLF